MVVKKLKKILKKNPERLIHMGSKECQIIPDDEKQCVWMTAGFIAYKLCTRDYRCEECIFDQVIRNDTFASGDQDNPETGLFSASFTSDSSLKNKDALFYHQHHCWVKVENPEKVWIGIDGILARFVAHIKAVALPQTGEPVIRDQCFAHIIQERHIVPLFSPIAGSVLSANERLRKTPELLCNDCWEGGWLITISPENLEHDLRRLMFGMRATKWYQKKELEIVETSTAMLSRNGAVLGPTMQDGGEKVAILADALTSEQYCQILESLSRSEDSA
jgi:glycine cleavage system H protein